MKTHVTHRASRFIRMSAGMLLALALGRAAASDIYVSSTGSATAPYDAWTNAFTNVQAALDFAQTNASVANVYLAGQTFSAAVNGTQVYSLAGRSGLAVRGGYEANPSNPTLPGPRNPVQWPTALARSGTVRGRVLSLTGLTSVVFEGVTIRGGLLSANGTGAGVYATTSTGLVFDNCTLTNNTALQGSGAGLYLNGGSALLTNSVVAGNVIARDGSDSFSGRGAGIYINTPGVLTVRQSAIVNNTAQGAHKNADPPYFNGADGGGIYLSGGELDMASSVLTNNVATAQSYPCYARGGAIFNSNGKVRLRNVLIARNQTYITSNNPSSGILSDGTSANVLLENCTVVDNDAGKPGSVGLRRNSTGVFAVTNSIVGGHVADLFNFNLAHVGYSNIGDGQNAGIQGCHSVNPQFADALFYHLKSTAGHYAGGAFDGGSWATAAVNSPLIDRGNPASTYSREPDPNGGRINMGAYGNTEVAAKTPTVSATLPAVSNLGVGFRSHTVANLGATLTDDGGQLPDVAFHYWEAGTTATNTVLAGMREEGTFIWPLGGLVSGRTYEYRISAVNGAGAAWSGVASFSMLPVNATIYVSSFGDNTDASTWATAYTDALTAFAVAESGDTIRLAGQNFAAAPGFLISYVYRLASKSDLRIEGGYQATGATPGARDPAQWPTVLARLTSAAKARVLNLESLTNVTFDGLTIRDGNQATGGGIYVTEASGLVFENCRIVDNKTPNGSDGGGLHLNSGTVVLSNSWVANNQGYGDVSDNYTGRGGGAFIAGGTLTIRNSTIASNVARGQRKGGAGVSEGGGLYLAAGVLDMAQSVVTNNSALCDGTHVSRYARGGGIANAGGTLRLRNVLVARNKSFPILTNPSSGILATGTTTLESCTVADNDPGVVSAVGIGYVSGTLSVTNSIVWGHAAADLSNLPVDGGVLRNVGWSLFNDATMDGVAGCVSADPLFAAPAAGDYRLGEGSPALNVGKAFSWMIGATDLAGVKRIQGGGVDLGAYEVPAAAATLIMVR